MLIPAKKYVTLRSNILVWNQEVNHYHSFLFLFLKIVISDSSKLGMDLLLPNIIGMLQHVVFLQLPTKTR